MTSATAKNNPSGADENTNSSAPMGISGFHAAANETPKPMPENSEAGKESKTTESMPAGKPASLHAAFPSRQRADVIRMQPTKASSAKKRNKWIIPTLAIVAIILLGILAYKFIFEHVNFVTPIPGQDDEASGESVPATEGNRWESPYNGAYISNQDADKIKDKKPITVMVNNYVDARPSYGLSQADVVYEAVEEGGITRLMPVFYTHIPEKVMSVRSTRYYNVILASAYYPEFVHWGAAFVPQCQLEGKCNDTNPDVDAYAEIVKLGVPNIDGGNYACQDDAPSCVFGRDSARRASGLAIEHTSYVALDKIYDKAKEIRPEESWHKNIPPIYKWKFKDDAKPEDRGDIGGTTPITYNYWDTMAGFNVKWMYDKEKNEYVRYQGDVKAVDGANNQELRAKTVIVRFTKETPVGDHKNHLYQGIVGSGDALIFEDGKVIQAKWNRPNEETLDKYTDLNGNEVEFVRGQIWVQLVKPENKVNYQSAPPATTN
jgi:hypothetical protein